MWMSWAILRDLRPSGQQGSDRGLHMTVKLQKRLPLLAGRSRGAEITMREGILQTSRIESKQEENQTNDLFHSISNTPK